MKRALTDPVSDLLARMRNTLALDQPNLVVPHSNRLELILELLKNQGFIKQYKVDKESKRQIEVRLYQEGETSPITGLERVSKPGNRVYVKARDIPKIMGGRGIAVISTSQGVVDGESARARQIGGEFICKVW